MLRRATGGNASGSGSETLDATCHDSIYCSQSRLDTLVGIEQYPVDMSPNVGYDRLIDAGRRGLSPLARVVGKLTCGGLAPAAESDRTLQR